MTQNWEQEAARTRRWSDRDDDPGGILAAGLTVAADKFPIPDVSGLSPQDAEAVLARWRGQVEVYLTHLANSSPWPDRATDQADALAPAEQPDRVSPS